LLHAIDDVKAAFRHRVLPNHNNLPVRYTDEHHELYERCGNAVFHG
jgi:hypothetical protein